jgi:hypothetical protein
MHAGYGFFLYCGAAEECKQIEIEGLIVEDSHVL